MPRPPFRGATLFCEGAPSLAQNVNDLELIVAAQDSHAGDKNNDLNRFVCLARPLRCATERVQGCAFRFVRVPREGATSHTQNVNDLS